MQQRTCSLPKSQPHIINTLQKKAKRRSSPGHTSEEPKLKRSKSDANKPSSSKHEIIHYNPSWEDYELLVGTQSINENVAKRLTKLFDDENTIPFIARYRKDQTGNLTAEQLRDIKDEYDNIKLLKMKIRTTLNNINKQGQLDSKLRKIILGVQSVEELELIYAPFRPGAKRTLAERAKSLGLEPPALSLLEGAESVNLERYINKHNRELSSIGDVERGVMHIIASVIATDTEVLALLRKLRIESFFTIECKKANNTRRDDRIRNYKTTRQIVEESKFANYFTFSASSKFIKPHQVLAINRGEAHRILSVKINVPDFIYNKFSQFATTKWIDKGKSDKDRKRILEMAVSDAYKRLLQPHVVREVRASLKVKAEKASCEVFSTNLKQLLLMPPVKGKYILGMDPGFSNGCQLAMISETGALLTTGNIFLNTKTPEKPIIILAQMLRTYNCTLIALGNGTACRETETWLSELIQNNTFSPLDVVYTIVNEDGASIYSCSSEARKEFPDLDPKYISAVSLARRVLDPLAELVKVEPKHLGVGMYQHDLPKRQLEEALDEVVTECVSFVGVDLNTASRCLLRHIAGLSDKRASRIIQYREDHGLYKSRMELKKVKGIGSKIFEQCAGFLRVEPANSTVAAEFYEDSETNRLDCTYIHPESYGVATEILKHFNLDIASIGQRHFFDYIKLKFETLDMDQFSASLSQSVETVRMIMDSLIQPLNYDLRDESVSGPVFKKGLTNFQDLKINSIVSGNVSNVTHFGCFVDIGVGTPALIHSTKTCGFTLQIGDKVEAKVISLDEGNRRIGLLMIRKI
ncbi:hypothetical protein PPYR_00282 [Photinus pyralis]|uniref:S1 motif domain-containing protein n=1 Tax=Photinus pyralis TaxID=7054 RepID=A0A5N4ABZ1_PHOPY|nr:hypothetical protein PPYR_11607 [Photinus pyralis]KAB0803312.1 hypothetical protein PPYR_00282 [Photinus pyralis]